MRITSITSNSGQRRTGCDAQMSPDKAGRPTRWCNAHRGGTPSFGLSRYSVLYPLQGFDIHWPLRHHRGPVIVPPSMKHWSAAALLSLMVVLIDCCDRRSSALLVGSPQTSWQRTFTTRPNHDYCVPYSKPIFASTLPTVPPAGILSTPLYVCPSEPRSGASRYDSG